MKYIVSILIFLLAAGAAVGLYSTRPETKKAVPSRPVPLVETRDVSPGKEKVIVEVFGTVIPAKHITLQSEVEGRIISQNPELIPGGVINEGEILMQIDPSDYELRVKEYSAELEEALFELDLEQGKQVIAEREWKLMEKEIAESKAGKSLALREPHLRLVKAKVEKARSRLAIAELELQRTIIRSPFNALVIEEFIDKGQFISRQTPLATLVGADQFRVQVSVPANVLPRISEAGAPGQQGGTARVIFEPVDGAEVVRHGHVLKIMGDIDHEGRMARILISIDDPLNLHSDVKDGKVLLGSYVRVSIDAGFFNNVYSIPRQSLREGDVIWVKDNEGTLQIRAVDVVWRRKDDLLVNADLKKGDKLILSRLPSPLPGIEIRSIDK